MKHSLHALCIQLQLIAHIKKKQTNIFPLPLSFPVCGDICKGTNVWIFRILFLIQNFEKMFITGRETVMKFFYCSALSFWVCWEMSYLAEVCVLQVLSWPSFCFRACFSNVAKGPFQEFPFALVYLTILSILVNLSRDVCVHVFKGLSFFPRVPPLASGWCWDSC